MTLREIYVLDNREKILAALQHLNGITPVEHLNVVAWANVIIGRLAEAAAVVERALKIDPRNPTLIYVGTLIQCHTDLPEHRKYALIRDGCLRAIGTARSLGVCTAEAWPAYELVLYKLAEMTAMVGPEEVACEAAQKLVEMAPDNPNYRDLLSSALAERGDLRAAAHELKQSFQIKPSFLNSTELEDLISVGESETPSKKSVLRGRYPATEEMRDDLRGAIQKRLLHEIKPAEFGFLLSKKTSLFTMGSCFAREISRRLVARGYQSFHLEVSEAINSTYANLEMLRWAEGTLKDGPNKTRLDHLLLPVIGPEKFIKRISETELFIYTLGVAPCFFRRDTGEFVLPRQSAISMHALSHVFEFRTTSVSENVQNLKEIHKILLRYNPNAKIVLTVSPVPLKVTFERESAVLADCLSKSTLRVAAEEFINANPRRSIYWPSFEIVRWLGGHVGPFFGGDDGAANHVNTDIIWLITDLFIELFETGGLSARS